MRLPIRSCSVAVLFMAGCGGSDGLPPAGTEGQTSSLLATQYSVTELGTLGSSWSSAKAINDHGQVIGSSGDATGRTHCFIWTDGAMIDLGTLGGDHCSPRDINNRGQVVGNASTTTGDYHAFLWEDGHMADLGTAAPYLVSVAWSINDDGLILGDLQQNMGGGTTSCAIWKNGVLLNVGTLGGNSCHPRALSENGVAVGSSRPTLPASGPWFDHVFRWQGRLEDLGIPGEPTAINEQGFIVGSLAPTSGFEYHGFIYADGALTDLGVPGHRSFGHDINESGVAVGSEEMDGQWRGWMYREGVRTDLPWEALRVNDFGQIILNGAPAGQNSRGWLYQAGQLVELPSLYSQYSMAADLNNAGVVVGEVWVRSPTTGGVENHAAIFRPASVDGDGDGIPDPSDGCPTDPAKGAPGACGCGVPDADADSDGIADCVDICPLDPQNDGDQDGICGDRDNCPTVANPDQMDSDGAEDGGDACDTDDDDDGISDVRDNCPLWQNPSQDDRDGDGAGDVCDTDDDGDGVQDGQDRCPSTASASIVDIDGCSIADTCACGSPWKNHGAYVSCVAHASNSAVTAGWLTAAQRDVAIAQAASSSCGDKKP